MRRVRGEAARAVSSDVSPTRSFVARHSGTRSAPRRYRRRMDRDALRTLQQPLKNAYTVEPGRAVVTLRRSGVVGENVTCSVSTGRALAEAGLHPASGGDGSNLCSGDMLLEALVACAGVTLAAVSTSIGVGYRTASVHAEGDLDFRGTLGVSKEAPVGFRDIRLRFEIDADNDDATIAKLIELTERYCVVLQTIRGSATITTSTTRSAGA